MEMGVANPGNQQRTPVTLKAYRHGAQHPDAHGFQFWCEFNKIMPAKRARHAQRAAQQSHHGCHPVHGLVMRIKRHESEIARQHAAIEMQPSARCGRVQAARAVLPGGAMTALPIIRIIQRLTLQGGEDIGQHVPRIP